MSEFDSSPEPIKENRLRRFVKKIVARRELKKITREKEQAVRAYGLRSTDDAPYTPEQTEGEKYLAMSMFTEHLYGYATDPTRYTTDHQLPSTDNVDIMTFPENISDKEKQQRTLLNTFLSVLDQGDQREIYEWLTKQPHDHIMQLSEGMENKQIPMIQAIYHRTKSDQFFRKRLGNITEQLMQGGHIMQRDLLKSERAHSKIAA